MSEQPAFIRKQLAFAAHIRDPQHQARPDDVEERRMAVYRELIYNNVESFVASAFPVVRSLYDDAGWHRLVGSFFAQHRCRTPYFLQIAGEFLQYLEYGHAGERSEPPFLLELAHYEWLELTLQIEDETAAGDGLDPRGDLLDGVPVLSSLARPSSYRYPVHRIGRGFRPSEPGPQPTHLLVLRDADDLVRFHEINAVSARLLALLGENGDRSGRELLECIAAELQHPDPATVVEGGSAILEDLRAQGAILGIRAPT